MTAAEMDIVIGAEVSGAVNGLKQVNTQLIKTEQTAAKVSKKTGTDFTNLNRVIQDLPFGFTAIQNNITQLVPAAGGLGVAIAVITSAITFAQVGFSAWTRGLGQTKEELDEVSKSVAGAQTEIVKISSLLSVARGLGETTEARTNAIKELQKEYPGYLANLNLENVNSQETSHAIEMLSDALTRKAKVQAISNLLTKANEKLIQAENTTIQENILSINAFLGLLKRGVLGAGQGIVAGATKETAGNINEASAEVKKLSNTLAELTAEQARGNDFSLLSPTAPPRIKKTAKTLAELQAELIKSFNTMKRFWSWTPPEKAPFESVKIAESITTLSDIEAKNALEKMRQQLDKAAVSVFSSQGILTSVPLLNDTEVKENFERLKAYLTDFTIQLGPLVADAFASITNALASGDNPFAGIFNMIGDVIQQLGKSMIALSPLLGAIRVALQSLNPVLALAAGFALVGIGSLLKNLVPKFATGGVVTQPTLALVGEQGPERITPLGYEGRANNIMQGEVIFQISGQVLRGILRRANDTAFNTF